MSKNIENAMYYSWMSQASYLDLRNTPKPDFNDNLTDSKYAPDKVFSEGQAEIFVEHYDFVHHLPNTNYGTSATVFEDKSNKGNYTIASVGWVSP